MKTITMRRTSCGRLGHYLQGRTYTVPDDVAAALAAADACELASPPAPAPAPEAAEAAPAAEAAEAKPKPKPRRRRARKSS